MTNGLEQTRRDVTRLLGEWRSGKSEALSGLMVILGDELHGIAERHLRSERADHTLQATALVHEAYLRLVGARVNWTDRVHFMAVAARTMRRVLVDYARARATEKRGGRYERISLEETNGLAVQPRTDLLDLDDALTALAERDERKARVVELHYFAGMSHPEIAEVVGVSEATVARDLSFSRAWLRDRLDG